MHQEHVEFDFNIGNFTLNYYYTIELYRKDIAMSPAEKLTVSLINKNTDFNRLPTADRISKASSKYAAAVEIYASTSLSIREIAEELCLSPKALSQFLARHHRNLVYKKYGMDISGDNINVKIKSPRGQSRATHLKYKDAIAASGDIAFVEFNLSQIAHMYGVSGTGLASQLKVHYPNIIPAREELRKRLGIADRLYRGALPTSKSAYEKAVPVYMNSDLTIQEVADIFGISRSGFGQYMRFYHHDAIISKAKRRQNAKKVYHKRKSGTLSGNGQLYGPRPQTTDLYKRALAIYKEGRKTLKEIIQETGVPPAGFKHHLDQWCRDERHKRKKTKYGEAIASLRDNPRTVTSVAKEFGLNADVFREYLKKHLPELAEGQGMIRTDNGKLVKKTAWEKYRPAIEEYHKEGGSLRSIADKHGLKYTSFLSFLKRIKN